MFVAPRILLTETVSLYDSDGKRGYIQYRDRSIDHLFHNNDYEEVIHLLMFGTLPTTKQKENFRRKVALEMQAFPSVISTIQSFE